MVSVVNNPDSGGTVMVRTEDLTELEREILTSAMEMQCDVLCDMANEEEPEVTTLVSFEKAKQMYHQLTGQEWTR